MNLQDTPGDAAPPVIDGPAAWQAPQELSQDLPMLLLDDGPISVQLIDDLHWRGRAAADPRAATLWRERVDVVLQRSEPGFAASTLGL